MEVTTCLYCGNASLEPVTHRVDSMGILRCPDCGLMMVERLSDDTAALYGADYFEKAENTKNGYTNYLSSPVANLIGKYAFSRLFVRDPGNHLDLGSADGSLMEIFSEAGFVSRGLEISAAAVDIARAKGLDATVSKLDTFPTKLQKSDLITAFDLIEHISSPRETLAALYDNLQEGGYFVFSTLSVQRHDPTEYWFQNSLEHYLYFNEASLSRLLADTFGAGNFAFTEIENNGIAEFWGVARKGKMRAARSTLRLIKDTDFDRKDPEAAYMLSLFYNQISQFDVSAKIIKTFETKWAPYRVAQARFYNLYFQGKFEKAVDEVRSHKALIPASQTVFWQALSDAEERLFDVRSGTSPEFQRLESEIAEKNGQLDTLALRTKADEEVITGLRTQLFRLGEELSTLKNSRLVGKAIVTRERAGKLRHSPAVRNVLRLRRAPHRAKQIGFGVLHKIRVVGAVYVPAPVRRTIKSRVKAYRAELQKVRWVVVPNKPWQADRPLVSVVIPYYNRKDTIDDTLDSLTVQTFDNFEVLIVDDGSPDKESVQKLQEIKKAGFKARYIHQENQGVSAARNNGISQAKGKYVICLDSDDMLDPTFIEKCATVLETNPDAALATTHQDMFGVVNERFIKSPFDPLHLDKDNMVITAAAFRKEAWEVSGGYKSGIGYEDWEFWINLSEHGFWGRLIPEPLFKYRTALSSRFVDDKTEHWNNLALIRSYHQQYKKKIRKLMAQRKRVRHTVDPATAFINLDKPQDFRVPSAAKERILITVPWMTFGGAETLIYNYCREIKDKFDISFVTGLPSEHEWEYKFKEITPNVYHLANLFDDERLHLEFVSDYIRTRKIDILHIIHNGFTFQMLSELKKRHPHLKVAVTMFNDRVEYFEQSIEYQDYIDVYTSDNAKVTENYQSKLSAGKKTVVIPNGINCYDEFNPALFDIVSERTALGLSPNDLAVLFVGRLSEEKNPDVFVAAGRDILARDKKSNVRFYVVGDGPMRPEIEKAIRAVGSNRIQYLGYQATPASFFSAADVFVLPSSIEGFPLSILEAMAMHAVVIASDVGAVSQVIESGVEGFVVSPGSAKEISEAIRTLNGDRKLLEEMKARARASLEQNYSNIALGNNYYNMYKGLMRPKKTER